MSGEQNNKGKVEQKMLVMQPYYLEFERHKMLFVKQKFQNRFIILRAQTDVTMLVYNVEKFLS